MKHYIDKESWINRLWQTGNVFCIIALIGLTGAWFLSELLELTFEELANILSFDNTAPYV